MSGAWPLSAVVPSTELRWSRPSFCLPSLCGGGNGRACVRAGGMGMPNFKESRSRLRLRSSNVGVGEAVRLGMRSQCDCACVAVALPMGGV